WVDIDGFAIHRLHPASGVHNCWDMPSEPSALGLAAGGGLVVALREGLAHFDSANGIYTPIAPAPYDTTKVRFNDGRVDAAGRFWIGTMYEPRDRPDAVLYALEHGALRDSGNRATVSNGVAFSPDMRTLYHSDTTSYRISAYDYDVATGAIGSGRLLHQFSSERGPDYGGRPDGAAVDSQGNYWCAMYEGGRLLQLSSAGAILREILLPVRCPTMMAFGGSDLRTLYITTVSSKRSEEELAACPLSGCLLSLRVDVAGQAEHPYIP
ncbi:MAG: putative gluconolactonase with senescence marker, partial [Burkholderia sp.]|nr:putative gluconolactonase with senescence marker [Burkholderia sp.]